jgi:hypothetical protein
MDQAGLDALDPSQALPIADPPARWFSLREVISPMKLYRSFFNRRSLALLGWTIIAIYVMNIFNALAYSRMPVQESLPDVVADSWKGFARLRASDSYMRNQPADMLSVILTIASILSLITFWDKSNVKKLAVVYNLSLHLRTILFSVSGLPPTCIGTPKCPCAVIPWAVVSHNYSIPNVAFKYTFGLGLFLDTVPQCGDLTMSGHTIYLWVLALFCLETLSKVFSGCVIKLIKLVVVATLLMMTTTIVLIRNHYTIDILLGTVFTNLLWMLHTGMEHLVMIKWKGFLDSTIGSVFVWIQAASDGGESESAGGGELLATA